MPGESIHVELSRLARGDQPYRRYKGSLTTPRCSDVVEWIVIAEPLVIGLDTFRSMQGAKLDVGFANARPPFLPTGLHQVRFTKGPENKP